MNKKILIGSIIAVVILVLVSFTSVVGYSSVKSDSKVLSPLFGIRTNKANNKKKNAITCDFINKGKAIKLLFPKRPEKVKLVVNFIDYMNRLNEKSLDRVSDIFYNGLHDENKVNIDRENIREAIYFISENPELSKNYLLTDNEQSGFVNFTYGNFEGLECIRAYIIAFLFVMALGIFFIATIPINFIAKLLGITTSPWCCGFGQTLMV